MKNGNEERKLPTIDDLVSLCRKEGSFELAYRLENLQKQIDKDIEEKENKIMNNYYVVNLEDVEKNEKHPYTLIFKGYIPTFGRNDKLYTFKYNGDIIYTDACMPENVKKDFEKQLAKDFGCGKNFNLDEVRSKLEENNQYRMKM